MSNSERDLLILLTKVKYKPVVNPDNYDIATGPTRTIPLGNTEVIKPENVNYVAPVLSLAIIDLTDGEDGPVAIALLLNEQNEQKPDYPLVGLQVFLSPHSAVEFLFNFADKWVKAYEASIGKKVGWKMIIDDRTNSHLDQIQDRLDDPLDSQDELIKLIKSIHEVSFNIPYTFLNTALVHLLAESDKKKQLLDSAKYLKNPDNLN